MKVMLVSTISIISNFALASEEYMKVVMSFTEPDMEKCSYIGEIKDHSFESLIVDRWLKKNHGKKIEKGVVDFSNRYKESTYFKANEMGGNYVYSRTLDIGSELNGPTGAVGFIVTSSHSSNTFVYNPKVFKCN